MPSATLLNYNHNIGDITEVGQYPNGKSGYGVLDMAGNVYEWVADWFDVYPGGEPGSANNFGQISRSLRGSSWGTADYFVGSANRSGFEPNLSDNSLGFRCAKSR